jgi:hypothetical protein
MLAVFPPVAATFRSSAAAYAYLRLDSSLFLLYAASLVPPRAHARMLLAPVLVDFCNRAASVRQSFGSYSVAAGHRAGRQLQRRCVRARPTFGLRSVAAGSGADPSGTPAAARTLDLGALLARAHSDARLRRERREASGATLSDSHRVRVGPLLRSRHISMQPLRYVGVCAERSPLFFPVHAPGVPWRATALIQRPAPSPPSAC